MREGRKQSDRDAATRTYPASDEFRRARAARRDVYLGAGLAAAGQRRSVWVAAGPVKPRPAAPASFSWPSKPTNGPGKKGKTWSPAIVLDGPAATATFSPSLA